MAAEVGVEEVDGERGGMGRWAVMGDWAWRAGAAGPLAKGALWRWGLLGRGETQVSLGVCSVCGVAGGCGVWRRARVYVLVGSDGAASHLVQCAGEGDHHMYSSLTDQSIRPSVHHTVSVLRQCRRARV